MSVGADPPPSFEQALEGLDRVVHRLESGDVGLEEAVGLFEEGRRYVALCRDRLAAAQRRIEEITAEDPSPPPPF